VGHHEVNPGGTCHTEAFIILAHSATLIDPAEGPLHFPPTPTTPPLPPILYRWTLAVLAMWTNQVHVPLGQALAQRIRVAGLVIDQPLGALPGTPPSAPWSSDAFQRGGVPPSKYLGKSNLVF
jgi:hypothetical protein